MSFILRPGTLDDAAGIASVQVTTWRDAYATIIDSDYLAGMTVEAFTQAQIDRIQTDSGHRTVATIDGKVVGYAVSRVKTDEPFFYEWFMFALYVLPECQGLGIGKALINDTKTEGHKRGFTRLVFGVFSENEPSKRFYRRNGAVFIEMTACCPQRCVASDLNCDRRSRSDNWPALERSIASTICRCRRVFSC